MKKNKKTTYGFAHFLLLEDYSHTHIAKVYVFFSRWTPT